VQFGKEILHLDQSGLSQASGEKYERFVLYSKPWTKQPQIWTIKNGQGKITDGGSSLQPHAGVHKEGAKVRRAILAH